ncbi:isoprenoid synthase domain-containing protein [Mycena filopes]|nr:isoprenoid synthase domain-containing protein [Mycena filopes]KAJ7138663.1 isoprenoid synthase domain-containing protein [Mycena filopes]
MLKLGAHDYVQTLQGQTLKFPDFDSPMRHWPKGVSAHYEDLRVVQHIELKKLVGEGRAYEIRVGADCPPYAATFFPNASWDTLRLASQVATFLFLWDDDTDNPELTNLLYDLNASNSFRKDAKKQFNRYMADAPLVGVAPGFALASSTLTSVTPIGEAVAFRLPRDQRTQVLAEAHAYFDASKVEQLSELGREAPTIDQYLRYRGPVSGMRLLTAFLEHFNGIDLEGTIRNDEYVRDIFEATVCIIALMNDMFSIKKELRYPFYNNAIAGLYHQHQGRRRCYTLRCARTRLVRHHRDSRRCLDADGVRLQIRVRMYISRLRTVQVKRDLRILHVREDTGSSRGPYWRTAEAAGASLGSRGRRTRVNFPISGGGFEF